MAAAAAAYAAADGDPNAQHGQCGQCGQCGGGQGARQCGGGAVRAALLRGAALPAVVPRLLHEPLAEP